MKLQLFIIPFLFLSVNEIAAQSHWSVELHGGGVYNLPVPLSIHQENFPALKLTARYSTDPFTLPVYWDMRFSRWQNNKSFEFEIIHHKLYLDNITPEVQKFNISHGYNMLFLNRGFDKNKYHYRAGAGMVLAHPESKIRGKEFGDTGDDFDLGYYLTGPVANLGIGRHFRINNRFYLNTEAKTTLGYSKIRIAEGHADVYHMALHLVFGFGFDFIKQN
ncbi:MAG: hypothetical protein WAO52_04260 [Prolixibacteraceae bacterium]